MNKFLLFFLFVSSLAFGAPSGTLVLSGTVAAVNSIVITPNGTNNTTLNITGGVAGLNVASVQETSNDALGYKITIQSVNGGQLVLSTDATKKTPYQISYNGAVAVSPTTLAQTVKTVNALVQQTVANSAVTVNVTALPNALAGIYNDTLTVAIVAN